MSIGKGSMYGPTVKRITDIGDVDGSTPPIDNDHLVFNAASGKWEPSADAMPPSDLDKIQRISSTGLIDGGGISIGAPTTTVTVAAGNGVVYDNWTDPNNPIEIPVSWSAFTNVPVTNIGSQPVTHLLISSAGALIQQGAFPTNQQRRDNILLGSAVHPDLATVSATTTRPDDLLSPASQLRDLFAGLGIINLGIKPEANGANLSLNFSGGDFIAASVNFSTDRKNLHTKTFLPEVLASFFKATQTGILVSPVTVIDNGSYDVGGVVTAIPGSNNQATNQRVFKFPNGDKVVHLGQNLFATLTEAISAAQTELFTVFPPVGDNGILIGIISVTKGATALNSLTVARILGASKLGEIGGATAGIPTSTLQTSYEAGIEPEILTNAIRGAVTVKRGSASDDDNLYEGKNGADETTFSVNGNGDVLVKGNGNKQITMEQYSSDTTAARIRGRKARGTLALPTAILLDDVIANFEAQGHDGVGFFPGMRFRAVASENWTPSAMGARFAVQTVAKGDTSAVTRLTLDEDGLEVSRVKNQSVDNTQAGSITDGKALTYDSGDTGYKEAVQGNLFLGVHSGASVSASNSLSVVTIGKVKADINGTVAAGDKLRVSATLGHLEKRNSGDLGDVVAVAIEAGTDALLNVILLQAPIRPLRSMMVFKFPQILAGTVTDLILATDGTTFIYHGDDKRIIGVQAKMGTPDTGTEPVYDLEIGAVDVFTNTFTNSGTADTFGTRESTVAAADTDLLQDGDKLVLSIGTAGGNGDGFDLEIHVEVEEEIKI